MCVCVCVCALACCEPELNRAFLSISDTFYQYLDFHVSDNSCFVFVITTAYLSPANRQRGDCVYLFYVCVFVSKLLLFIHEVHLMQVNFFSVRVSNWERMQCCCCVPFSHVQKLWPSLIYGVLAFRFIYRNRNWCRLFIAIVLCEAEIEEHWDR